MQPRDSVLVYRYVIDAINRNDAAALDDVLAEQLIDHNPIPNRSPGRTGFKEWMAAARTSFLDLHGTIEDLIASGDRVVGRVTWHGAQHGPFGGLAPTHKLVAFSVIHIIRFEADTIVEWWGMAGVKATSPFLGFIRSCQARVLRTPDQQLASTRSSGAQSRRRKVITRPPAPFSGAGSSG